MIRIFEHIDQFGDSLTVEDYGPDAPITATVTTAKGVTECVELTPEAVAELRAKLRPHEEVPGSERAEAFQQGYEAAQKELEPLDPARVEALFLAANVAKDLRTDNAFGSHRISHETVLAYALFLLDELPIPAAQQ
ncbi:hypothetical protein ACFOOK_26130 [Micromonospora krabiensis]|uniref:Uncharacterized protein n=1 Tax=Micromonospora krabiensis TaxID=307121 RepID=A0A1C3N5U6_9ACTN|nr:hypothetical protein [Micromonospora krabiensis]SBV27955.1 hypothetical protein GA0070620_3486 [Micromonospora krabiensis]